MEKLRELIGGGLGDITDACGDFIEDAVDDEELLGADDASVLDVYEDPWACRKSAPRID